MRVEVWPPSPRQYTDFYAIVQGHLSAFGLKAATLATFSKKKVKKADCFDAIVFTNLTLAGC